MIESKIFLHLIKDTYVIFQDRFDEISCMIYNFFKKHFMFNKYISYKLLLNR